MNEDLTKTNNAILKLIGEEFTDPDVMDTALYVLAAQAIGEECGKTAPFTVGVLTLIMSRDPDNDGIDAYCAGLAKCADVIQEAYS